MENNFVYLGNDCACEIHDIGDTVIKQVDGKKHILKDVRHVHEITKSLISTRQVDDSGFIVAIGKGSWKISKGRITILKGQKDGSLCVLHGTTQKNNGAKDIVATTRKLKDTQVWHSLATLVSMACKYCKTKTSFLLLSILFLSSVIIALQVSNRE